MNFSFNRLALIEYERAARWYRARSERAAGRFIEEIERSIQLIAKDPSRFQRLDENLHVYRVRKYPYRVIYLLEEDSFIIYAVEHGKRRPGYWRRRLPK